MKKTITSILALAAGIMILAGCSKENSTPAAAEGVKTLTAVFPESPTKTAIDGTNALKVNWSAGDEIIVYSKETESAKFTLSAGAGTPQGAFTGSIANPPKGAFYPYNTANVYGDETASLGFVPTLQRAPKGSFDPKAALMVGIVDGDKINFNWAVSFFKITAPSDVENLAAIVLSGPIITGKMSINTSTGEKFMVSATAHSVTVKPEAEDGKFVAGSDYYATAICDVIVKAPLKVTYIYVDKETHKAVTKARNGKTDFSADNGYVTAIPALDMTSGAEIHTATQLEKDGPFYADFNLGATITDYGKLSTSTADNKYITGFDATYCTENVGGLYTWNYSAEGFPNVRTIEMPWTPSSCNSNKDTATGLWGGAWRQPTYSEITDLVDKEKFTWESMNGAENKYCEDCTLAGRKVTSRSGNAYTNSIFLPAAGYSIFLPAAGYYESYAIAGQGSQGRYWSCDPYDHPTSEVYAFSFTGSFTGVENLGYDKGFSIRPVLALDGNLVR